MHALKKYIIDHFEEVFVLIVLLSVASIYYFATYKLAFLNFFFLPVLMAGAVLGLRYAVIGSVLCVLLVLVYLLLDPSQFQIAQTELNTYLQISLWGSFLILAGALVGKLYNHLQLRIEEANKLNKELGETHQELIDANEHLSEYANNLQSMVEEKTSSLTESKRAVEQLKGKVEEVLHMSMDPNVAKMMIENRLRNEKKNISSLMADLQGFSSYSESRQPEIVIQQLNSYFSDMSTFMDAYHAHLDAYTGDGFILEFGAPVDHKNHAILATICGLRMMEFMRESNYPWKMRVGVSTGFAIMGLIGGRNRRSYTAIGNCMNLSSRLEGLCPVGSMLIDQGTLDLVIDDIDSSLFISDQERETATKVKAHQELKKLEEDVSRNPDDVESLLKAGKKYLELGAFGRAKKIFFQALHLDPESGSAKLGYAEASLKEEKQGQTAVRGMKDGVLIYEVLGIKDPLFKPNIPQSLVQEFGSAIKKVPYACDLIYPAEIIGGKFGSSIRVALLSYALAARLNVGDKERQSLIAAAYLRDIGMQIVPHALLTKESGFTDDDMETIRQHPRESVRLLQKHGYNDSMLLECVRNHHQKPDGAGYPPLKDGESAAPSRISCILAITDSYESLTSNRPWRDKWNPQGALGDMRVEAANGKFDKEIFKIFEKMMIEALGKDT